MVFRVSSKYVLADSTGLGYSRQEEERTLSNREYMPSIWQV
jgi:DNA-repair protein XRCC2